jgi:hypothetical protein
LPASVRHHTTSSHRDIASRSQLRFPSSLLPLWDLHFCTWFHTSVRCCTNLAAFHCSFGRSDAGVFVTHRDRRCDFCTA